MAKRMLDQIAIVTGASSGIGRAIAIAFAREGATVAGIYHPNEREPTELLVTLGSIGRPGVVVPADVSQPDAIVPAITAIERTFGRVDCLVTSAGHADEAPVTMLSVDAFDRMLAVHLRGTFLCCQAVLPGMIVRGHGTIITMTSQLAYIGAENLAHYAAAKAGVVGFTKSLAREVARRGIRVNGIAPGPVRTDILPPNPRFDAELAARLPIGRFAVPEEIAPTAVFLASADSSFYIGQILGPNGGEVM